MRRNLKTQILNFLNHQSEESRFHLCKFFSFFFFASPDSSGELQIHMIWVSEKAGRFGFCDLGRIKVGFLDDFDEQQLCCEKRNRDRVWWN